MEELDGEIANLEFYRDMAYDENEIAQYVLQLDELYLAREEILEYQQQQLEAKEEINNAKAQAAEAQKIAEDLASGDPEALERVLVSAQAAWDRATADLAEAQTKAGSLNTEIADKNA